MRRFLTSTGFRIFATCWILYSLHFATNVVREHYPAFSLAQQGDLQLDEYQGFHPDIFVHSDGHSYVNNNIGASVLGAIPLFILDPLLDYVERQTKRGGGSEMFEAERYRSQYANSRELFRKATERGLHLRFGAATCITSVLLMAPLSALTVVLMFHILMVRGVSESRAVWLALLFAFGTPMFFRASLFNHNTIVMYLVFFAFYLIWIGERPTPVRKGLSAGFLCGYAVFVDYGSVVLLSVVLAYVIAVNRGAGSKRWVRPALTFLAGTIPALAALFYTQWSMFGNPFLPAQYWMPAAHYTDLGWRGFSWPGLDAVLLNLFDPAYGLFVFGPVLVLGLLPPRGLTGQGRVLPAREWRMTLAMTLLFLLFCSANQYSRMQWNTGFRYLAPLVPMLYLAACNHLRNLPRGWLLAISIPCVMHSWVLSMMRESSVESWRRFLSEGVQLPWLTVLRQTVPKGHWLASNGLLPAAVLALGITVVGLLWFTVPPGRDRSQRTA